MFIAICWLLMQYKVQVAELWTWYGFGITRIVQLDVNFISTVIILVSVTSSNNPTLTPKSFHRCPWEGYIIGLYDRELSLKLYWQKVLG